MRGRIRVYKALSDESRLRVLNLLIERECCVCEVMQALEISQSKASRILRTLYDVGFLELRKEGLWSLYSINWDGMDAYLKRIVDATREALKGDKQMEMDRENLRKAKRVGPGSVKEMRHRRLASEAAQP